MAAMTCMYTVLTPASKKTCRSTRACAEHEVEELAQGEDGRCRSMLVGRKQMGQRAEAEAEDEGGWWWEGVVRREMEVGEEEAWAMVSSFGGMKRWNAKVEVCEVVEGEEGEAGCVRFCAGGGRWVKEKLLAMEREQHRFTYSLLDSSYGFQDYTATLAILPSPSPSPSPSHAVAHWTFRMRPVPQSPPPHLLSFLTSIFDSMMCSLERTLQASSSSSSSSSLSPPPQHPPSLPDSPSISIPTAALLVGHPSRSNHNICQRHYNSGASATGQPYQASE